MTSIEKVCALCDWLTKEWDPAKLRWGWGEALFTYALAELDNHLQTDRYLPFYKAYCDRFVKNKPVVDCSDTAAPALTAFSLYRKTADKQYLELTRLALDYIRDSEKILEGLPNHFGTSKDSKYPCSVWVDSLMMFSYFTAFYGEAVNDAELTEYAAKQPAIFAKYLMDTEEGCWYHAYWVKQATHYPRRKLFWGRGNGWVALSLPMIYEKTGETSHSEEIKRIYRASMDGILKYRRKDGAFNTIINKRTTYRELSATALVAAGIYQAVRQKMLPESYLVFADKAYKLCIDSLIINNKGVFFPEISRPTVPMQYIPELWYRLMPRGNNWNYGVAALIFAAIQEEKCKKGR